MIGWRIRSEMHFRYGPRSNHEALRLLHIIDAAEAEWMTRRKKWWL